MRVARVHRGFTVHFVGAHVDEFFEPGAMQPRGFQQVVRPQHIVHGVFQSVRERGLHVRLGGKMHHVGHVKQTEYAVNLVLVSQVAFYENVARVGANIIGDIVHVCTIIQRVRADNPNMLVFIP